MTTLRVNCPICRQESMLHPSQVSVVVYSRDASTSHILDHYSFTCLACNERATKEATPAIVNLLVQSANIAPIVIPLVVHEGPPIVIDDVLNMCLELKHWDGNLDELTS